MNSSVIFDFSVTFQHIGETVYWSQDQQTSLFSNFFIKNGSYGTIHIFKNYFITVFSIFNF